MQVGKPFRFHTPSSILVVGPSGCGKTVFTEKLLLENRDLFEKTPTEVHYCYGVWQDRFQPMQDRGVVFHKGIPDHSALVQWFPKGQGVMVLDDLMDEGSNDKRVLDLFTKHSHHQNVHGDFLVPSTCFPWANMPKAFPAMLITSWLSRTRGINWESAMCCFNRFLPRGKTVWTPFTRPPPDLMGIWCWICTRRCPINNGC